ncbi:MAG: ABC transporter ATP-binding protein/permease [Desulfovibrionaceae bacterium]|nr:ABC transporter ATP-binding protein/permease [Desulfovibrionaceae bacterium]
MDKASFSTFKVFCSIFKGYWVSEQKWEARGLLALVSLLNVILVYLAVRINTWHKDFFSQFETANYTYFWSYIGEFALVAFLYILLAANSLYLQEMLRLRWRAWLTEHYLKEWMSNQAYYRLQVLGSDADNPDQRISEDVGSFARLTLELLFGFLRKITSLGAFAVILWNLSGEISFIVSGYEITFYGYMFWACLIYAVIGTYLAHRIGYKLIGLKYDQQKYEANFRFSMMRVRENSESIAFYQGEKQELLTFKEGFRKCVQNYLLLMQRHRILSFYTNSYDNLAIIMPILMAAPRLFSGGFMISDFMQLTHAFASVKAALSFFVASYSTIASLASVIRRLGLFTHHMEKASQVRSEVNFRVETGESFRTSHLQVALPDGRILLKDCSIDLKPGQSWLITGASGCGKSTFLRTISGIWPFGKGEVLKDPNSPCLFLPQRLYLPQGSLRRSLCYPLEEKDLLNLDERLRRILELVDLKEFEAKLDLIDDWSRILSLGEQQRMAFARALLVNPKWIFLDEATSALDEQREIQMYQLLKQELPEAGIMSVGHRSTLYSLHKMEMHLEREHFVLKTLT